MLPKSARLLIKLSMLSIGMTAPIASALPALADTVATINYRWSRGSAQDAIVGGVTGGQYGALVCVQTTVVIPETTPSDRNPTLIRYAGTVNRAFCIRYGAVEMSPDVPTDVHYPHPANEYRGRRPSNFS